MLKRAQKLLSLTTLVLLVCHHQASAQVLTQAQSLHFGTVLTAGAGTVKIKSNDTIQVTGSNTHLGGHQMGIFDVTGAGSKAVYVVTIEDPFTVSDGNGNSMSIGLLSTIPPSNKLRTDNAGNHTFSVFGTLTINANQGAGTYTGTYLVTTIF